MWPLSGCPDQPLPPQRAPATLLMLQGSQNQTPGARLAAPHPGSTRDNPKRMGDPPGEKAALRHPAPPVRAPQCHWGHPAVPQVTPVSPPAPATTAQHSKSSPDPAGKLQLMLCSLGAVFRVFFFSFFQAKSGKEVTEPRSGLCSAKPGHVFRDQPGWPGSPPPCRMD